MRFGAGVIRRTQVRAPWSPPPPPSYVPNGFPFALRDRCQNMDLGPRRRNRNFSRWISAGFVLDAKSKNGEIQVMRR